MRVQNWPVRTPGASYFQVKTRISSALYSILEQVAQQFGVKPEQALNILLEKIGRLVETGEAHFLGPEWEHAWNVLLAADKAPQAGMEPIDVGRLHRSPRKNSASGFVGVYPNGKNFRAMARNPEPGNPQITLGTFRTPELAAWKRYLFYKQHQLVYGELEDYIMHKDGEPEMYRKYLRGALHREPTDAEVVAEVNQALIETGCEELVWEGGPKLPEPQLMRGRNSLRPNPPRESIIPKPPKPRVKVIQVVKDDPPSPSEPPEDFEVPMYLTPEIEALLDAPDKPGSR